MDTDKLREPIPKWADKQIRELRSQRDRLEAALRELVEQADRSHSIWYMLSTNAARAVLAELDGEKGEG